jgi:hypothetical protein
LASELAAPDFPVSDPLPTLTRGDRGCERRERATSAAQKRQTVDSDQGANPANMAECGHWGGETRSPRPSESDMALAQIDTADDLAAWMRRMNLTLTAAAAQLGRKRATISGYINGATAMPQSVGRHAAIIEAARGGQPFPGRPVMHDLQRRSDQAAAPRKVA